MDKETETGMISIRVAKTAGVCFGVERALNLSEKALMEINGPISSLGPLIHNPQTVQNLEERGLKVAADVSQVEGTVVFRSHGVAINVQKEAESKGLKVVDATCPLVKVPQNFARKLSDNGYFVVIVGDESHPEIIGVKSYVENGEVAVVKTPDDVERLPKKEKVGVICQTTLKRSVFDAVVLELQSRFQEVKVHNTICSATRDRQQAALELALEVECMIVVGGRNSSNTAKLFDICKENAKLTYLIETEDELRAEWFSDVSQIGVTAGASTPHVLISRVQKRISELIASHPNS